jgi:hypothetical protein
MARGRVSRKSGPSGPRKEAKEKPSSRGRPARSKAERAENNLEQGGIYIPAFVGRTTHPEL